MYLKATLSFQPSLVRSLPPTQLSTKVLGFHFKPGVAGFRVQVSRYLKIAGLSNTGLKSSSADP